MFFHLSFEGSLSFDCQHGERECEANIIHCCSIEAIHDPSTKLNFVACMIRDNNNPQEAFQRVCESRSSYENIFNYKIFIFSVQKSTRLMLKQFKNASAVCMGKNCWKLLAKQLIRFGLSWASFQPSL